MLKNKLENYPLSTMLCDKIKHFILLFLQTLQWSILIYSDTRACISVYDEF